MAKKKPAEKRVALRLSGAVIAGIDAVRGTKSRAWTIRELLISELKRRAKSRRSVASKKKRLAAARADERSWARAMRTERRRAKEREAAEKKQARADARRLRKPVVVTLSREQLRLLNWYYKR
jgi:ribosomal protein L14E/L6E/L27E